MQKGKRERGQSMMQGEPAMSPAPCPPDLSSMDSPWCRESPWHPLHNLPQTSAGSCALEALLEKNVAQNRDQQRACPSFQPKRTQRQGKASRWCTALCSPKQLPRDFWTLPQTERHGKAPVLTLDFRQEQQSEGNRYSPESLWARAPTGITEMNGIAPSELHPLELHWTEALAEQNT